jgi:hypothetical protein
VLQRGEAQGVGVVLHCCEARLAELGVSLPPARRRLPPATAQPGLPFAA